MCAVLTQSLWSSFLCTHIPMHVHWHHDRMILLLRVEELEAKAPKPGTGKPVDLVAATATATQLCNFLKARGEKVTAADEKDRMMLVLRVEAVQEREKKGARPVSPLKPPAKELVAATATLTQLVQWLKARGEKVSVADEKDRMLLVLRVEVR